MLGTYNNASPGPLGWLPCVAVSGPLSLLYLRFYWMIYSYALSPFKHKDPVPEPPQAEEDWT